MTSYNVHFMICLTPVDKVGCKNVRDYGMIIAAMKVTINPIHWSPRLEPRNHDICVLYASGKFTTEQIAKSKSLNVRQIQRIAAQGGVIRSLAQSNRVMARLKSTHRIR